MSDAMTFELLHYMRLKGIAPLESLAELVELPVAEVQAAIDRLADQGIVRMRDTPRLSGWTLTEEGRSRHLAELAAQRSQQVVAALAPVYDRFLALNGRVKELSTAWQGLAPDDAGRRWNAIEELREVQAAAAGILNEAAAIVPRLASYATRLAAAIERLDAGDERYFTGVTVDSFHTVWFECHEDLIQTLGRERVAEGSF